MSVYSIKDILDSNEPEIIFLRKELFEIINDAIRTLSTRERIVYGGKAIHKMTYKKIGSIFNLCPQRVSQIYKKAERQVNKYIISRGWE